MSSTTVIEVEEVDVIGQIGRHWGLVLALGILTTLTGIVAVSWPQATIVVIAVCMAFYLLMSGIVAIVRSFSVHEGRFLLVFSGAVSVLLGLMCLRGIAQSIEILALLIGFGWMIEGIMQTVLGLQNKGVPGRGWLITTGVLLIIGSLVILSWPVGSLVTLAWIMGVFLIILGISEIIGSFRVKKLAGV